jgi:hypothetical protein
MITLLYFPYACSFSFVFHYADFRLPRKTLSKLENFRKLRDLFWPSIKRLGSSHDNYNNYAE